MTDTSVTGESPANPNRALEESRVRAFIELSVNQLIAKYVAIFGIVNLLVLVGIAYSVNQIARAAAKTEAEAYVKRELEPQVQAARKLTDTFVETTLNKITEVEKAYSTLVATKLRLETELATLQLSLKNVKALTDKESIPEIEALANALKAYKDSGSDVSKVLSDALIKVQALDPRLNKLEVSEDQLKRELADKMSVSKVYRMRSEVGEWYAGINDGRGYPGSILTVAAGSVSGPENRAVWWKFQQEPAR
jgi:hypothetical protein